MSQPVYTSAARQDLVGILDYIASQAPNAALEWIDRIEARCILIATSPTFGDPKPELGDGVRATAVGRYVIYYRRANSRVEVLRVIPGDRDVPNL